MAKRKTSQVAKFTKTAKMCAKKSKKAKKKGIYRACMKKNLKK